MGVEPGSVDIVILVFIISALHPNEWVRAIANIHKVWPFSALRRFNAQLLLRLDAETRRTRIVPGLWPP